MPRYVKEKIIYANVWEDPELNRQALKVRPSDTVLSITSGGCNSLNLLLENPARLISIDCNPAQLYLLELKKVAIQHLDFFAFRKLLGLQFYNQRPLATGAERLLIYQSLRPRLSEKARAFWDNHQADVSQGIVYCGSVERFFRVYRLILQMLYPSRCYRRLFFAENQQEQRQQVQDFPKGRFKLLHWLLLNRTIISLVKGKHSLRYVRNPYLDKNLNRKVYDNAQYVPLEQNYFLAFIVLGQYLNEKAVPPYLLEANYPLLKEQIAKLEIVEGTLARVREKFGDHCIDKFNLSNIMEWLDQGSFVELFQEVLALARPQARLCYRYTLAEEQKFPSSLADKFLFEKHYYEDLAKIDRSFMYESFHVGEVK